MSIDTIGEDYSLSSSTDIKETNSSSSSWASSEFLTSKGITSTAYVDTAAHQSPSASATPYVSADDLVTGSHTFKFNCNSQRAGFDVGKCLASNTFTVGGYDWAINLYPSGKKYRFQGHISLYIRLESDETDVNAVFEMMLVDQSGKGKHRIQTNSVFLMRKRGSQWGFGKYMKKKNLEKLGYLKDGCLVVNCVVGVLAFGTDMKIPAPSNFVSYYLSSSIINRIIQLKEFQGMTESNCEDSKSPDLKSLAKVIIELGSPLQLQGLVNDEDSNKFDQFLYAVDGIQQLIKSGIISTQGDRALKTLQLAFKGILMSSISTTISNSSSDYTSSSCSTLCSSSGAVTSNYDYELQRSKNTGTNELSSEQVYRLRSIVERLNSTGYLGDCIQMYRITRKSAVDARFLRFCIGKWTINDLQSLGSDEFTAKIRIWILAAHKCYNSIFPWERHYYEQIFDGVKAVTYDNCFLAIIKHAAVELNNFADAVCSIASFQKLFAVLELYKVRIAILPKIQNMFHSESFADISHSASINTTNCLPTLVRRLFSNFQDTVLNELLNTPPPNGTIHSLTEYTMNFVTRISLYKELLTNIFVFPPTKGSTNQEGDQFLEAPGGTPLRLHMISIMISLRINLKGKSSLYGDSSSRYVFIINNVNYIIKTITGSPELLEIIGKEYLSKMSEDVLQTAQEFSSSIWDRVQYCLRDDGLKYKLPIYNGILKNSVKNRFKTFNTTFEKACQTQSTMSVLDIQLRSQIHELILNKLLPTYRSFLLKFGRHIQTERFKERYIKYTSQDLENKLKSCFQNTDDLLAVA